jgi:hypothetical protein
MAELIYEEQPVKKDNVEDDHEEIGKDPEKDTECPACGDNDFQMKEEVFHHWVRKHRLY